jgi:hypothetical protein
MESHSKVSLEVNKAQVLMKLSTKREVPYGLEDTVILIPRFPYANRTFRYNVY